MSTNGRYNFDEWQATLTAHALAYGFLSKALYKEPSADFLTALFEDNLFAEWPLDTDVTVTRQGIDLLTAFGAAWESGQLALLKSDYNALFVGPDQLLAYPWESVYLSEEHLIFDVQTLEVREIYRRFGLQAPSTNREPDDHIGLELAFLVHLCSLGLDACERGDIDAFESSLQAQRGFLGDHVLRWAPTFMQRVIDNAATDFYRGVAYLGLGTLETVARVFDLTIQPVEQR
jgi:putative dimethyl sulfoxide reductase chaperone